MSQSLTIGIVAGELSGDTLGAGLIYALKAIHPDATFVGIGGPLMINAGCESLFDIETLSVMGVTEVLGRLPSILSVKKGLVKYFSDNPPDVFIGVDAPDFNLRIEKSLKKKGVKTVHYVSPSVWAWRQHRIHSIAKSTNLVLALLPFEKAFYDKFKVPCEFVGHTLADTIDLVNPKENARKKLEISNEKTWLAVLPGSRSSELKILAEPFLQTCQRIHQEKPEVSFIVALVNEKRRQQFELAWKEYAPELDFKLVDGTARLVLEACDYVLLASGTVALEAMLVKRPMVVGYKVNFLTAEIARRLLKTKYVSLPNILADRPLVPELLQENCTPEQLSQEVLHLMNSDNQELLASFTKMHQWIRKDADKQAAQAVLDLLNHSN